MKQGALRAWFYRLAAAQFVATSVTGLLLYFRPLDDRTGVYPEKIKDWLVMIHNGEWITHLLLSNRYISGLIVGVTLSVLVLRFALRAFKGQLRS